MRKDRSFNQEILPVNAARQQWNQESSRPCKFSIQLVSDAIGGILRALEKSVESPVARDPSEPSVPVDDPLPGLPVVDGFKMVP